MSIGKRLRDSLGQIPLVRGGARGPGQPGYVAGQPGPGQFQPSSNFPAAPWWWGGYPFPAVTDFERSQVPTFPTGYVYNRQIRCAQMSDDATVGFTQCAYGDFAGADSCCRSAFQRNDIQACRRSTFA